MTYKIINKLTLGELVKEVNILLEEGWELQGGVFTNCEEKVWIGYMQAMIYKKIEIF